MSERNQFDNPTKGIALILVCFPLFTLLDSSAKYLILTLPVLQVVWMRYFMQFIFPTLLLLTKYRQIGFRTNKPLVQAIRSIMLLGSTACNFMALEYLQLTQTMAVFFAAPFLIALLSGPLLGEWVGIRRMIAIVIGFFGVLIVINPAGGEFHWAFLYSIAAVLCLTGYSLATRVLAHADHNLVNQFYAGLVGTSALFPFMISDWAWPQESFDTVLFIGFGAFGLLSHWFMVEAHKYASAGILAPYSYTQMIWMTVAGYLIFADIPTMNTFLGTGVIIGAGLYLFLRERHLARKRRRENVLQTTKSL